MESAGEEPRKVKKKQKSRKVEGDNLVPSPIKVKIEKVKKTKVSMESEETENESEIMMPTPIRVKAEKSSIKNDSRNVAVPHPINIKMEQKPHRSEADDEDDSSSSEEDVPVPAPIQIKNEISKSRAANPDDEISPKKKLKVANKTERTTPKKSKLKSSFKTKGSDSETDFSRKSSTNNTKYDNSNDTNNLNDDLVKAMSFSNSSISDKKSSSSDSDESDSEEEGVPEPIKVKMEYLNESADNTPKKKKSLVENIQSKYSNVSKIKIAADIPKSDNCFLLTVPKTIDPTKLIDLPWELDRNLKFNLLNKKDKYIIKPLKDNPNPCLVIGSEATVLNINKVYTVTKHISKKKLPDFDLPEKTTIPLPENLITRHPLFGSDYKSKINLRADVKTRLNDAVANLKKLKLKELKKKKPKKVKKEEENSELIFNMFESHTTRKLEN